MSGKKCKHCGSSEIEVDPARGDVVCTSCGTVLEDNIIVAEIEFQENAHGGASTLGQFVSSESKGGATGFGGAFTMGIGQESREITLRKAREGITALCQQLRLSQQCIDIACNFFKMALSRHLTIGRPASHTRAACVYMTCRTEGTPHLLIDISDALQICCYQLGRTYYKLSKALCISIPPTDPCLYILRFVSQLKFEDKSHDVSMTALRLVQRMKRDSIHSGRRPSGICGAALLIAARLHNFSRTPADVVRIVKVHETTLRKRMMEFGETPSSSLTVDEFMTVDLEEEQDPPAFRAARKRDKERLQKLLEEEDGEKEMTELQKEIERHLKNDSSKKRKAHAVRVLAEVPEASANTEDSQAKMFVAQDTLGLIDEITKEIHPNKGKLQTEKGLAPDLAVIGLGQQPERKPEGTFLKPEPKPHFGRDLHSADELVMSEKDELYLDALIMSEEEARHKSFMWNKINAGYLKEQQIKRELKEKELEEGKDKKRKLRGSYKKKTPCNAATAGEAVEKMLAEKRFSMKIDYDILKTLDQSGAAGPPATPARDAASATDTSKSVTPTINVPESPVPRKRKKVAAKLPASPKIGQAKPVRTAAAPGTPKRHTVAPSTPSRSTPAPATPASATPAPDTPAPDTPAPDTPAIADAADYDDYMELEAAENEELSLGAMLRNGQDDDDYYDDDY